MRSPHYITQCLGIFFVCMVLSKSQASKLDKGFEALNKNDYFKAKQIFSEINQKKANPYSAYGLALIHSTNNNPFFNSDSASKYINLSFNLFAALEKPIKVKGVALDPFIILSLADSIAGRQFQKIRKENSVEAFDRFLRNNYLAKKDVLTEAVYLRDELEFSTVMTYNRSDSTIQFTLNHPQSNFFIEAMLLSERQVYDESTLDKKADSYRVFLRKYPKSNLRNLAYDKLFEIYRQSSDLEGLKYFIAEYPNAPQNLEAWKLLFTLFVKSYTNSELKNFLDQYPDFPLKNSILKELELNTIALFAYQQKDLSGFVNTDGRLIIPPVYDAVTDFFEGLSVVNRNDSVFFINKENTNVFSKFFTEAFPFKNGIAPVKQNNKWFFINRLGQVVSKSYDEIGELSNGIYVIRLKDKYGALDLFGQIVIAPKFSKLGDFKNDFAYYVEDNKYGFVSKQGIVHKADFEWISDFNTKQVAVIKKNDKYGLVNAAGKKILDTEYDQVLKTNTGIFIVVMGNNYGFFSSEGCFISQVAYEYYKDKPTDFYTNGDYFKLIKKGEQSLTDKNGRTLITFDTYNEVNFFAEGLMRVKKEIKKESKYGYLDKKLNTVIPLKYQQASDFADSVAIVKHKNKFVMLSYTGKEIFSSDYPLEKLSAHYYLMNDGFNQLLNHRGVVVYADIQNAQVVNPWLLIVTLGNGEIKLLYD